AGTALSALVFAPSQLGFLPAAITGFIVPLTQPTPLVGPLIFSLCSGDARTAALYVCATCSPCAGHAPLRQSWWDLAFSQLSCASGSPRTRNRKYFASRGDTALAAIAVIPVLLMQCDFALVQNFGWRGWLVARTAGWSFPKAAAMQSVACTEWHLPVVPLTLSPASLKFAAAYLISTTSWAPPFL